LFSDWKKLVLDPFLEKGTPLLMNFFEDYFTKNAAQEIEASLIEKGYSQNHPDYNYYFNKIITDSASAPLENIKNKILAFAPPSSNYV
jgi:hypothetical protein